MSNRDTIDNVDLAPDQVTIQSMSEYRSFSHERNKSATQFFLKRAQGERHSQKLVSANAKRALFSSLFISLFVCETF